MKNDINVVIDAHTRWQIIACLIHIEKNIEIKSDDVVILLNGAPNNVKASTVNIRSHIYKKTKYFYEVERGNLDDKYFKNNKTIILTTVNFPVEATLYALKKNKKIPHIIRIEEGVGSYAGVYANLKQGFLYSKFNIKTILKLLISHTILRLIRKAMNIQTHLILKKLDEELIKTAVSVLRSTGTGLHIPKEKTIIVLEDNISISKKDLPNIIFKRHPHFSRIKKGSTDIDKYTTEEIMATNEHITTLIGSNSSSLIYCSAILGRKTYNTSKTKYPDPEVDSLFKTYTKEIDNINEY